MASPQVENGFTRIANELLDEILRFGFGKRHLAIVLAIIRKTYGYQKKADEVSATQIEKMTGIPRQHVASALVELSAMRVVLKQDGRHANSLSLNKNYGQWRSPKKGRVPRREGGSPESVQNPVPNQDTQKTTPIENSKRKYAHARDPVPEWISEDAWRRWELHCSEIRKPIQPTTKAAQWQRLRKLLDEGHDPADVIDNSIAGGWSSLHPPDKPRTPNGNGRGYETPHERIQRLNSGNTPARHDAGAAGEGHGTTVDQDGRRVRG